MTAAARAARLDAGAIAAFALALATPAPAVAADAGGAAFAPNVVEITPTLVTSGQPRAPRSPRSARQASAR